MIKKDKYTQKEAARKALEILGGRAQMKYICLVAAHLIGDNTQAKDVKNNVRREIYTNSTLFQRVPNMPDGWWELTYYQEEMDGLKREIDELKGQLAMKDKTIEELKAVKTEDDFVQRIVRETKRLYKHEKEKTEVIRQILYKVGRGDAEEELDAWIEDRQYKPLINVAGDYVLSKNVENEVQNVEAGGIGVTK